MPLFDGFNLFGYSVSLETADNPLQRQENAFAGLNGVESLAMGLRGRFTTCRGVLFGATPGDLASVVETFRGYNDGAAYTLVDSCGTTWLNVVLDTFQPEPKIGLDPYRGYFRKYSARFRHLT